VILVTGGTGFLGSKLLQFLIDDGRSVIALKRASSTIPDHLKSSSLIQWVEADITDYFSLEELFVQVSQVYHCAAKISYQKHETQEMLETNIEGTRHIVNLCLAHQVKLVHVSSIAALGTSKLGLPVTEEDKWEDKAIISKYTQAKYESELEVWRGISEGLDAIIVNPSVIIGVGSGGNSSRAIFNMVNKGNKIYPLGSVGLVDVSDVAQVMIQLMESDYTAERYILNTQNISNLDLLSKIAQLMGKPAPRIKATPLLLGIAWRLANAASVFTGKKPALTRDTARAANTKLMYNNTKIKQAIGFSFKPLDQTLAEVCEAYYK